MEITEIRVFPVEEEKLKAFVSIVFDNCFIVSDIKVINGNNGLFLSMPSKKSKNGKFRDIAHPLNNETREWISKLIIEEYEKEIAARGVVTESDSVPTEEEPPPQEEELTVAEELPTEEELPAEAESSAQEEELTVAEELPTEEELPT